MSYQCDLFVFLQMPSCLDFIRFFWRFFVDFLKAGNSQVYQQIIRIGAAPLGLLTFTSPTKTVKVERLRLKPNDDSLVFWELWTKVTVSFREGINFEISIWLQWWRKKGVYGNPCKKSPEKGTFIKSHCWWVRSTIQLKLEVGELVPSAWFWAGFCMYIPRVTIGGWWILWWVSFWNHQQKYVDYPILLPPNRWC